MKKYEVETNPEVVGKKQKKALADDIEGVVKENKICRRCVK